MEITFVLPCYPDVPVGGFRVVYEYANALVERGHRVRVVHTAILHQSHEQNGHWFKRVKQSIKHLIYTISLPTPPEKISWQAIDNRIELMYVPNLSEKYIPDSDVVIATAWQTADYVNRYSSRKGRKYYLIQGYETWSGSVHRVNQTWLYPMKKIVIAKWLQQLGEQLGANDLVYVPNAIDHQKFKLTKPIVPRSKRVAMLYAKADWKGAKDGIAALERAKQEVPDLQAVLFGVTTRDSEIPEWMDYYQNPDQDELVNEIYQGSSIYLCPSWSEGWGLPAAESSACGCALVSTANGGVQDFAVHGETALLSPSQQPMQLSRNLIQLLQDEQLRISLAQAGCQNIQKFTYEKSTDLLESYLMLK